MLPSNIVAVPPAGYLSVKSIARELGLHPRGVKARIFAHHIEHVRCPMVGGGVLGIYAKLEDVASLGGSSPPLPAAAAPPQGPRVRRKARTQS